MPGRKSSLKRKGRFIAHFLVGFTGHRSASELNFSNNRCETPNRPSQVATKEGIRHTQEVYEDRLPIGMCPPKDAT